MGDSWGGTVQTATKQIFAFPSVSDTVPPVPVTSFPNRCGSVKNTVVPACEAEGDNRSAVCPLVWFPASEPPQLRRPRDLKSFISTTIKASNVFVHSQKPWSDTADHIQLKRFIVCHQFFYRGHHITAQ